MQGGYCGSDSPGDGLQSSERNAKADICVPLPPKGDLHYKLPLDLPVDPDAVNLKRRFAKRQLLKSDVGDEGWLVSIDCLLQLFLPRVAIYQSNVKFNVIPSDLCLISASPCLSNVLLSLVSFLRIFCVLRGLTEEGMVKKLLEGDPVHL
jgi:hypothetical protein